MAQTTVPNLPVLGRHLTSGRLLAKNTIWNLFGSIGPMLVGVVCIPFIIRGLGADRFGVLTLAWALIGYASLFDLGLGRALTKLVAETLGRGSPSDACPLVWTTLLLMLVLGLAGGLALGATAPWLVERALRIPAALQGESLAAFYFLAFSIPIVLVSAGLRGLLQALQCFGLINLVAIPIGILSFAAPLLVLQFSHRLAPMVAVLVGLDLFACLAYLVLSVRAVPELRRVAWHSPLVRPLLRFGGWMTVSNVVSPLMFTMDRFLIGTLVSIAAVAYYATPHEVVTKLFIIPSALVSVLFPAFSTSSVHNPDRTVLLFGRAVKFVFLLLFPITLLVLAFGGRALALWLGQDFAMHSAPVLRWLIVGVFINSLAQIPFALIQGMGRPDLTAKLHLLELPCYLAALWFLTRAYGIEGAAIAWVLRIVLDTCLLFFLSTRVLRGSGAAVRRLAAGALAALALFGLVTTPMAPAAKAALLCALLIAFAVGAWRIAIGSDERAIVLSYAGSFRGQGFQTLPILPGKE
jgi:O-antigen/teichoic acid export membrane protein